MEANIKILIMIYFFFMSVTANPLDLYHKLTYTYLLTIHSIPI